MNEYDNYIWITWERQRRSIELANILNCKLYILDYKGFFRYPICIIRTIWVLLSTTSKFIFVQNPSMILTALVCLYSKLSDRFVIVDRHSTFRLNNVYKFGLDYIIFNKLHSFTIRTADITIVTNNYLANLVNDMGGRSFVLPDKVPTFSSNNRKKLNNGFNILFCCSYAKDEPISEVIEAFRELDLPQVTLYISGNYTKLDKATIVSAPHNIVFTGFLSDDDYIETVNSVDAMMVLTTADHTMLCGCYEAVAASKPLITSNKPVLYNYFTGCIFVDNTREEISSGIKEMLNNYDIYLANIIYLKSKLIDDWYLLFNDFKEIISEKN